MNATVAAALRTIEEALSDPEPAPVSIVLVRSNGGKVHRAARVEGIAGLMTYEADNLDDADVLHDLSRVADELDLCQRCFGPVEEARE